MKEQIKKTVSLGLTVISVSSIVTFTAFTKAEAAEKLTRIFESANDRSEKNINGYMIKMDTSGVYIKAPQAEDYAKTEIGGRNLYLYGNTIYYQSVHDIKAYDLASGSITTAKSFDGYDNVDVKTASNNSFVVKLSKSFFDREVCSFNVKNKKTSKIKADYLDSKDDLNLVITEKKSFDPVRTLYKVTDKGLKKYKVISKVGYHTAFFGKKKIFYFEKSDKKNTVYIKSCNFDGKKAKTLKTVKIKGNMNIGTSTADKDVILVQFQGHKNNYKIYLKKDKVVKVKK